MRVGRLSAIANGDARLQDRAASSLNGASAHHAHARILQLLEQGKHAIDIRRAHLPINPYEVSSVQVIDGRHARWV